MSERFTTPVGRFLQGDAFKAQDKDQQGQPRVVKQGPNAGQPNPQYFIGLAIPKTPGVATWQQEPHAFFQTVARVGMTDFPGGQTQRPDFAWKIRDGDSAIPNKAGRIPNQQEGFAGHWVCAFASSYPPKCFARPNYAATDQITDPARIKRGHYISINGSVSGNGNMTSNPGVYLNLDMVSWEGFGPEITSGPDANDAFAQAPQLPAGASAVPVGAPAPTPAPVAPVPAAAVVTPPPYAGFMTAPTPPLPPINLGHVMLPPANGATYEQMTASGWTDALLVQHGMMAV